MSRGRISHHRLVGLQDGVGWFHHSGNLWRNDGENVAQTSRNIIYGEKSEAQNVCKVEYGSSRWCDVTFFRHVGTDNVS